MPSSRSPLDLRLEDEKGHICPVPFLFLPIRPIVFNVFTSNTLAGLYGDYVFKILLFKRKEDRALSFYCHGA